MKFPENGIIKRIDKGIVEVSIQGKKGIENLDGVTCDNPEDPEEYRIYKKRIENPRIYLPNEYERAVKEVLRGDNKDVVVMGGNGYSSLNERKCAEYGVKIGAYESACEYLLESIVNFLRITFRGIDLRVAHGASNLGVDKALIKISKKLNLPQLGHSCPHFLFFVDDDDIPIYVGKSQEEYSDKFIESLDFLVAMNGRYQAFTHDINAALKNGKHIIPINVIRSISDKGGPPAFGPNGEIEDAVAAFEQRVHAIALHLGFTPGKDPFDQLTTHVQQTTKQICRKLLSPERAFQVLG